MFDSIYFNDINAINHEIEYVYGICKSGNNSYSAVLGSNVNSGIRNTFIMKNDSIGRLIKRFNYNNITQAIHNPMANTVLNNKLYVVGTHIENLTSDTGKMFLHILNLELDSIDYKTHNFPLQTGQFNELISYNSYLYGAGFTVNLDGSYSDLFVTKLDTLGNLIWVNKYGQVNRNETAITIQEVGNKVMISGYSNEGATADGIALLIDTLGNQIFFKHIDYLGKWNVFAGCFSHADGGFICPGNVSFTSSVTSTGYQNVGSVTKLNSIGNAVWTKLYDLGERDDSYGYSFVTNDSSIIAVGGNNNVPQFHEAGLAVKYTMEGDTMWTRTYNKSYNQSGYIDHFYKGLESKDGGYLFAGQSTSGIISGITDAWLLKTDTIGCNPNYSCWPATHYNNTGLKNSYYKSSNLTVFPNPATNYVYVKFNNPYQNNACIMMLYNSIGQLEQENSYNHVSQFATLDLNGLAKGLYVFKIITLTSEEHIKIIKN
jgi:hypothetical protein